MNIVCIGAHPDDAEMYAGGTLVLWARAGARVLMVSTTNGDIGHHVQAGGPLARRRAEEARESARRGGMESLVLDYHDGEFQPTLESRKRIVRILREWKADIVITHRPNDYHPDHRYTAMAVQDAAYMVMVPFYCPDVTPLRRNPVFLYMMDRFQRPAPFQADIAVDVGPAMDTKWNMIDAMESQLYEWLPWIMGQQPPPADPAARRGWLESIWSPFFREPAGRARTALERWYPAGSAKVEFAELFEICEYGRRPSDEEILDLFPFLPRQ